MLSDFYGAPWSLTGQKRGIESSRSVGGHPEIGGPGGKGKNPGRIERFV